MMNNSQFPFILSILKENDTIDLYYADLKRLFTYSNYIKRTFLRPKKMDKLTKF